ncbi:hypothetical protein B0H19DRAFT_1277743 [Mycena capillaripes]|nr:hypothetical protein B0H19DRAFT_1277743 [Mycena capillaripes]
MHVHKQAHPAPRSRFLTTEMLFQSFIIVGCAVSLANGAAIRVPRVPNGSKSLYGRQDIPAEVATSSLNGGVIIYRRQDIPDEGVSPSQTVACSCQSSIRS